MASPRFQWFHRLRKPCLRGSRACAWATVLNSVFRVTECRRFVSSTKPSGETLRIGGACSVELRLLRGVHQRDGVAGRVDDRADQVEVAGADLALVARRAVAG